MKSFLTIISDNSYQKTQRLQFMRGGCSLSRFPLPQILRIRFLPICTPPFPKFRTTSERLPDSSRYSH